MTAPRATDALLGADAAVEIVDRLVARRAEVLAEYERIGAILAAIRDKAGSKAAKPKKSKRRKGLPAETEATG